MRVLFPFRGNTVGGSHISAVTLIKALPKFGFEPVVAIHQHGPLKDLFIERRIPFKIIEPKFIEAPGGINAIMQFPRIISLSNFLKSQSIDIVHTNDGAMTNSWVPAARLADKPSIVHVRRVWRPSRISDWLHFQAGHFIAISDFVHASFPNAASDRATIVTNPAVQPKTTKAKSIDECQTVVMVGTHTHQKRPEIFIAAAAKVAERLPNVRYLIVGRVTEHTKLMRRMINTAGLNKIFTISDYTPLVADCIANAALLVAPAIEEGHGRTLIEAMMLNTPVAASRSGGHVEIVKDFINGRLFDVDDPASMADVIFDILSNPKNTAVMTREAAIFAARKFKVENHVQSVTKLYRQLVL